MSWARWAGPGGLGQVGWARWAGPGELGQVGWARWAGTCTGICWLLLGNQNFKGPYLEAEVVEEVTGWLR